jgi:hypothetical protein
MLLKKRSKGTEKSAEQILMEEDEFEGYYDMK